MLESQRTILFAREERGLRNETCVSLLSMRKGRGGDGRRRGCWNGKIKRNQTKPFSISHPTTEKR